MQTSSLNISLLKFEYTRTYETECGKTIHDFEPIFLLNLVQMIRKGAAVADLIYGSFLSADSSFCQKWVQNSLFLDFPNIHQQQTTVN